MSDRSIMKDMTVLWTGLIRDEHREEAWARVQSGIMDRWPSAFMDGRYGEGFGVWASDRVLAPAAHDAVLSFASYVKRCAAPLDDRQSRCVMAVLIAGFSAPLSDDALTCALREVMAQVNDWPQALEMLQGSLGAAGHVRTISPEEKAAITERNRGKKGPTH